METQEKTLQDHGLRVIESMTTPTRPGKKPRPVFIVAGKVEGFEEIFRSLGGKKFRGQWSFWNNPARELLAAIEKFGRLSFAEQVEARCDRKLDKAERYEGYADNAESRAAASSKSADEISRFIPMGQPILVGHHSERRHRRDLSRIGSKIRRSIEESKKAEHLSCKAGNLERDARRIMEDRSYIMNRIEEEEAYLRRLKRHAASYSDYQSRANETEEKIAYWKSRLSEIENKMRSSGRNIATPENIKPGFWIKYTGTWYEVVRVSSKTVTIKNWLDVPTFTWKPRYADIDDFRDPKAAQTKSNELAVATQTEEMQPSGGVQ